MFMIPLCCFGICIISKQRIHLIGSSTDTKVHVIKVLHEEKDSFEYLLCCIPNRETSQYYRHACGSITRACFYPTPRFHMGSKGETHIKLTISMCNFACQRQMGLCPCSEFAIKE